MYMHLFVALPLLHAMLNMFLETSTEFMEKVAQVVKMNGCYCASLSLLTAGERKDDGAYHAEETVTVYMSPTTLDNLSSFLAVNTDYTEMEEEPNYLASVDNPIMSIKTSRGKGHSFSQPRLLYQVRYLNRLLRFNYLYAGNLLCQCCVDKLFGRLYTN